MLRRWNRLPHGGTADEHCVAERSNGDRGPRCATSLEGGREASKRLWRERDSAMKNGRCSGLERHCCRPGALVRAIMRTQGAVLRAAGRTCRRSRKDYPQFAEFPQYQTLAYEA
jgi:hypothetical protein